MPFQNMSQDDQRRALARRVLDGEASIAQAARDAGVSRPTAHAWVQRAREQGIEAMAERSRRPHNRPAATETVAPEIVTAILAAKDEHPAWGARKVHAIVWPPDQKDRSEPALCVRTVHRVLERSGRVGKQAQTSQSDGTIRFERADCNALWQIDYKGVGLSGFASPLSILDDCSRFCLALRPVAAKTGEEAWRILWDTFGEYGLPQVILSDNGDGFNNARSLGPTWLQARLWRAGVQTVHGRVRHPQTQGKVERFHRTMEVEMGHEAIGDPKALSRFRDCYNWIRPHEALEMRAPGALYQSSDRSRPAYLPAVEYASNAIVRKVDSTGKVAYRNARYRAGRGLTGEYVELRESADGGDMSLWYAGVRFAALADVSVV